MFQKLCIFFLFFSSLTFAGEKFKLNYDVSSRTFDLDNRYLVQDGNVLVKNIKVASLESTESREKISLFQENIEITLIGSNDKLSVDFYSKKKFNLIFDNLKLTSVDGPAVNIQSHKKVKVSLVGESFLEDSLLYSTRALENGEKMEFKGSGTLNIKSLQKHSLASDNSIEIKSGNLILTSNQKDGIRVNEFFKMISGRLNILSKKGKGIKVKGVESSKSRNGYIIIDGGDISIDSLDKGMTASWSKEGAKTDSVEDDPNPYVMINGGHISIITRGVRTRERRGPRTRMRRDSAQVNKNSTSESVNPEGIESKTDLIINGGIIEILATDDALNASNSIKIFGGKIYAHSTGGDGIDSNGTVHISGGTVIGIGAPGRGEGGIDCDRNEFTISGGTIIAVGGRNSTPTLHSNNMNSIVLSNQAKSLLNFNDSLGNTILSYQMEKDHTSILISSDKFTYGGSYHLLKNGNVDSYESLFNGLFLNANISNGEFIKTFRITSELTEI